MFVENTPWWRDIFFPAVGCERYEDGSSILVLNDRRQNKTLECVGEKIIGMRKTTCSLLPNKTQYLHNETWKALEMKTASFEIRIDATVLKVRKVCGSFVICKKWIWSLKFIRSKILCYFINLKIYLNLIWWGIWINLKPGKWFLIDNQLQVFSGLVDRRDYRVWKNLFYQNVPFLIF